jgi:hypothetical protein
MLFLNGDCGERNANMSAKKKKSQADEDWEKRTLCSDEACIGVIGVDGHCKECGKPYEGDLKPLITSDGDLLLDEDEDEEIKEEQEAAEDEYEAEKGNGLTDLDWENRILCSDESCIGVIGPDGKCKECGKPSKTETP